MPTHAVNLWDQGNRAFASIISEVKNLWNPPPKTLERSHIQSGMGMELYPKGTGLVSVPVPADAYKSKYTAYNRRVNDPNANSDAGSKEYSTRTIRIPRGDNFAGVNPEFLGIPPTGKILFASEGQKRAGFTLKDSSMNTSGWQFALTETKVLDSSRFVGDQQMSRTRYTADDPLY